MLQHCSMANFSLGLKIANGSCMVFFNPIKKHISVLSIAVFTVTALICPLATATETDSYTYSCVPLEDSSEKLNIKLNEILSSVVGLVNQDIMKFNYQKSDSKVEFSFSYQYYKMMFVDEYGMNTFSAFETCIDTNKCKGWPKFERIFLLPKESIYSEADYNGLSKKFVASNIEACGVRFGVDKLSHLLKDGFMLYDASKSRDITDEELFRYSQVSEETFYGKLGSAIYSNGDIEANLNGVKLFRDLFSKHIIRQNDGLVRFIPLNICEYINPKFDERISKNKYYESKETNEKLFKVIEKRTHQCTAEKRDKILARLGTPNYVSDNDRMAVALKNILPFLISSEFRKAKELFIHSPDGINRKRTQLPKEQ